MKKFLGSLFALFVFAVVAVTTVSAAPTFFNGFEVDTSNWNDYLGSTVTRVGTGTNGVTSSDGSFHAILGLGDLVSGGIYDGKRMGPYTDWGGYESVFPSDGYVTQIDVYLDMSVADGSDMRMDYSSAINKQDGDHLRDFIFHLGTKPSTPGEWIVSASNNAPGWPANPDRNPVTIDETGWYTLRHTFENDGSDVLTVDMEILDDAENVLDTWTSSTPADVISTVVGGNRYGWIVTNDFADLPIDNTEKYEIVPLVGPPADKNECKKDGWMTFNNPEFKNQGQCVSFLQANERAGK